MFRLRIWQFMQHFQAEDLKFALKVAIAVLVTSIWGFLPATKDWYANWRGEYTANKFNIIGEWAPVAAYIVMSPSLGSSLTISIYRVIGTCVVKPTRIFLKLTGKGSGLAAIAWVIFPDNPYGLAFFTLVASFIAFYMKYGTQFYRVGLVGIAAYIVSA